MSVGVGVGGDPDDSSPGDAASEVVVSVGGEEWVVGSEFGAAGGGFAGGPLRVLLLDAARVAGGNATLSFVVAHERFATSWLGGVRRAEEPASSSPPPPIDVAAVHDVSKALASGYGYHDDGWTRGWASVVQPAISSVHLRHTSSRRLDLELPRARRYAPRGPELISLQLPAYLFSCHALPTAAPATALLVHTVRLRR